MSTVVPRMAQGGNTSALTVNPGTTFVAFGDQGCKQLTLINNTGVAVEFRQGGAGTAVPIFSATYYTIYGIANTNEISVRRLDTSNTPVTLHARWEA